MKRHRTVIPDESIHVLCSSTDIKVKPGPAEITISCGIDEFLSKDGEKVKVPLKYKDDNSGEYTCVDKAGQRSGRQIFVKFRCKFYVSYFGLLT